MKIEINAPDAAIEQISKGLLAIAKRNNPRFKTEKQGAEFITEVLQNLVDAAYEAQDPVLHKAKLDAHNALMAAQKATKEKLDKLKGK